MRQLMGSINKKKNSFNAILVSSLVLLSVLVFHTSGQIRNLANLDAGIQTCFSRLHQTYTARLLNDVFSEYLKMNFLKGTEECLGEVLLSGEENLKKDFIKIGEPLNTASTEISWFHKGLGVSESIMEKEEPLYRDLGNRFSETESLIGEALEQIDLDRNNSEEILNRLKAIFYPLTFLTLIFMIWQYREDRMLRKLKNQVEEQAGAKLMKSDEVRGIMDNQSEEIISQILRENDLDNCADLLEKYNEDVFEGKVYVSKSYDENLTETGSLRKSDQAEEGESEIHLEEEEQLSEENQIEISKNGLTPINIEEILTKQINNVSSNLFTKGITLNLNILDQTYVYGKYEELEQILYYFMLSSINNLAEISESRQLEICTKKLGGTLVLDIINNGKPFSEAVINSNCGLDNLDDQIFIDDLGPDFKIGYELLKDLDGKVMLENLTTDITGQKIRLLFKMVEKNISKKLFSIFTKGKKKEAGPTV